MNHKSEIVLPLAIPSGQTEKNFSLNTSGNELRYDVREYSSVTVQAVKIGTVWSTAVLTVYRDNDGATIAPLESAVTLGPGNAMSATIDTSSIAYLVVRLTTVEGAAIAAAITVVGNTGLPRTGPQGVTGSAGSTGATGAAGPANVIAHAVASDVNNQTATLANVTGLSFAIGASEKWCYRFVLDMNGDTISSGISVAATAPAGVAAVVLSANGAEDGAAYSAQGAPQVALASGSGVAASAGPAIWFANNPTGRVWVDLYVSNGVTAGNVQLQFAQQTATAVDTTIKAGSFGVGTKIS